MKTPMAAERLTRSEPRWVRRVVAAFSGGRWTVKSIGPPFRGVLLGDGPEAARSEARIEVHDRDGRAVYVARLHAPSERRPEGMEGDRFVAGEPVGEPPAITALIPDVPGGRLSLTLPVVSRAGVTEHGPSVTIQEELPASGQAGGGR